MAGSGDGRKTGVALGPQLTSWLENDEKVLSAGFGEGVCDPYGPTQLLMLVPVKLEVKLVQGVVAPFGHGGYV